MIKGRYRGHKIIFHANEWLYADSMLPVKSSTRECGYCGKINTPEGHDGCLGTLPGVMNACCGHGEIGDAYVQFSPRKCVCGVVALKEIENLKRKNL